MFDEKWQNISSTSKAASFFCSGKPPCLMVNSWRKWGHRDGVPAVELRCGLQRSRNLSPNYVRLSKKSVHIFCEFTQDCRVLFGSSWDAVNSIDDAGSNCPRVKVVTSACKSMSVSWVSVVTGYFNNLGPQLRLFTSIKKLSWNFLSQTNLFSTFGAMI